jgi:flagellar biosynthesis protein FlhF
VQAASKGNKMKIKKFLAPSLKAGKALVLKELGDDAVILSSRTIRKPGDSSSEVVEIVAAIDYSPINQNREKLPLPITQKQQSTQISSLNESEISSDKYIEVTSQIFNELAKLGSKIGKLSDNIKYRYSPILGEINGKLYKKLLDDNFSEEFALKIIGTLSNKKNGKIESFTDAISEVRNLILDNISTSGVLEKSSQRKIITFIGTTGSGKTTSLIKLAIISKLVLEANTLIISTDTHKVGGAEQLQTYSSVAAIPFQAVYSAKEFEDLLRFEENRDFIFVDTIGKSHLNKSYINELKTYFSTFISDYIYLVQPVTASVSNFKEVIKNFSVLEPTGLILSKLDEVTKLGQIVESLADSNLPVSYLTNGQKVPDDIEPATKEKLSEFILHDNILEDEFTQFE